MIRSSIETLLLLLLNFNLAFFKLTHHLLHLTHHFSKVSVWIVCGHLTQFHDGDLVSRNFVMLRLVLINKECNFAEVNVKSLSDIDSYDQEESISENGDEERYLFSSNSE